MYRYVLLHMKVPGIRKGTLVYENTKHVLASQHRDLDKRITDESVVKQLFSLDIKAVKLL